MPGAGESAGPREARACLRVLDRLRSDAAVCVVGSLNADLRVSTERLPRPGETVPGGPLRILPGGKSANQAVACALLGVPTTMVGAVGDDANGRLLLESLDAAGVATDAVVRLPVATGTAVITVDAAGENTIVVSPGANGELGPAMVAGASGPIAAAGALGLCLEVPDGALLAALDAAAPDAPAPHGAPAPGGPLVVLNPSPVRPVPDRLLASADVLIVNEHELSVLLGGGFARPDEILAAPRAVAAGLAGLGVDRAVVTLGAAGSLALGPDGPARVPGSSGPVVDTTGCGDSFMGALLACLAGGIPLADGARLAGAVSALAACGPGARGSYPDAGRVRDFLSAAARA